MIALIVVTLVVALLDLALTAMVWRHLFQPTKEN